MTTDWNRMRKQMHTPEQPSSWPAGVRGISLEGISFLGVHEETSELYWDGRKIVVQKPITLGLFERVLASLAAASGFGILIVEIGRSASWWGG